jgi:hypothetical protein
MKSRSEHSSAICLFSFIPSKILARNVLKNAARLLVIKLVIELPNVTQYVNARKFVVCYVGGGRAGGACVWAAGGGEVGW